MCQQYPEPVLYIPKQLNRHSLDPGMVRAPLPGRVQAVCVRVGQKVKEGNILMILEAMKLENEVTANCSGEIVRMCVQEGRQVKARELLLEIAPEKEE